jgi:hypothetical protein
MLGQENCSNLFRYSSTIMTSLMALPVETTTKGIFPLGILVFLPRGESYHIGCVMVRKNLHCFIYIAVR